MSTNFNFPGSFVISLDYELMWGILDLHNASVYEQTNVKNVHDVIKRMVELFERYRVKATFATVGMLMCKNVDEVVSMSPEIIPTYIKKWLSPYGNTLQQIKNHGSQIHYFAPESIELLKNSNMVEIGTHTFSHYYSWEEGQTIEQFEADIVAAIKMAKIKGIEIKSIVFPRNHVNDDYLHICGKHGITSYRGNALNFFGKKKSKLRVMISRIGRLVDTYIPISGKCSYRYDQLIKGIGLPINLPASRFFRPYSPQLHMLETVRISRIKTEIEKAAKLGEMYHLWWHPHNFGANMEANLKNLENVLKHFSYCREKYGMKTYTMNELSEILMKKYGK